MFTFSKLRPRYTLHFFRLTRPLASFILDSFKLPLKRQRKKEDIRQVWHYGSNTFGQPLLKDLFALTGSESRKIYLKKRSSSIEEKAITKKLKKIRLSKQLTLDKLATLSGLTKGYLSQIENSTQPPPIYTLSRIARALQIDIAELFAREEEPAPYKKITISRHDEQKPMNKVGTKYGYIYEDLASQKKGKNMEPFIVTVGFDRKVDIKKDFRHEGEEFLLILKGKMEFYYDGETLILDEGDSVYFDSDVPHSGRSLGDEKVKALIVIYSYKRN